MGKPIAPVKVGICGIGTVGQGLLEFINKNNHQLASSLGRPLEVTCLGMRTPKPHINTQGMTLFSDIMEVARYPNLDILIETIGGIEDAKALISTALSEGKHVITANKELIARHGKTLSQIAEQANRSLKFEAAVGGGIPIIKVLTEALVADKITRIRGILNGTSNYILTAMAENQTDFETALASAQSLNYVEADPKFDVDGIDSAHKLAILSALAFKTAPAFEQVKTEGISHISSKDIAIAEQLGYCIKPLAVAKKCSNGHELRVHPALLPKDSMLARVDGVMNAIEVVSEEAGTGLYYGAGAGAKPSTASIITNLIDIVTLGDKRPTGDLLSADQPPETPVSTQAASLYIRAPNKNTPKAISKLKHIMQTHCIEIKDVHEDTDDLALITGKTTEQQMKKAVAKINQDLSLDSCQCIKVEPQ